MTTLIASAAPPVIPTGEAESVEGEARFLIHHIAWSLYKQLLEIFGNSGPRMNYSDGVVELMPPLFTHEMPKKRLAMLVEALTEELGVRRVAIGSTTFFKEAVAKGAEPDEGFYLTNIERLVGQREGNLDVIPPPDLVIEVELTSPLLDKLNLYAGLGVPELCRWNNHQLRIFALGPDGRYVESSTSRAFPWLPVDGLVAHLQAYDPLREVDWIKDFRRWVLAVVAPLRDQP